MYALANPSTATTIVAMVPMLTPAILPVDHEPWLPLVVEVGDVALLVLVAVPEVTRLLAEVEA